MFKKGDKVKSKKYGYEDIVELVPGMEEYDSRRYGAAERGFVLKHHVWEFQEDWELIGSSSKTLENLEKGNLIDCKDGDTKKVLFVLEPGLYVLSDYRDHKKVDDIYSVADIESRGWKTVQEPEIKEMTVAEISKELGYEVKIIKA